jgi:hypothetical protein
MVGALVPGAGGQAAAGALAPVASALGAHAPASAPKAAGTKSVKAVGAASKGRKKIPGEVRTDTPAPAPAAPVATLVTNPD